MVLSLAALLMVLAPQGSVALPQARQIGEHTRPILRLALSPDGGVLVTAARNEVHAWDVRRERLLWKAAPGDLEIVALGVGAELVAFHHGWAAAFFLALEDGKSRSGIGGTTAASASRCLVVDPRDRWIWMGTDEGVMTRVVPGSVNSWSNRKLENGGVTCLAMDAQAKTIAAGGRDGTIRFLGAQSANVDDKKVVEAHAAPLCALAMDAKGGMLASASEAGELCTWKLMNGKRVLQLRDSGSAIAHLALDAKAARLAAGDGAGAIQIFDLKKGEVLVEIPSGSKGAVTGLAFVGTTLAVATRESTQVALWDLAEL